MHVGAADSAPGFDNLVKDIAGRFGLPGSPPKYVAMNDWNPEWDTIYPFSAVRQFMFLACHTSDGFSSECVLQFITPYKLDLPLRPEYMDPLEHSFVVEAVNDTVDAVAGTRKLTLQINHPGIIWTSMSSTSSPKDISINAHS